MAGTVHDVENRSLLEEVRRQSAAAARELADEAHLHRGQIVVVGCSTSEVVGRKVGSWSTPEVADAIFNGLHSVFAPMGVYIAAQCCEHLNRAIIVEHEAVPGLEIVNVVPQPKAGSSFATAAYNACKHPVAVEEYALEVGGGARASGAEPYRRRHSAGGENAPQIHRRRPRPLRRDLEGRLPGVLSLPRFEPYSLPLPKVNTRHKSRGTMESIVPLPLAISCFSVYAYPLRTLPPRRAPPPDRGCAAPDSGGTPHIPRPWEHRRCSPPPGTRPPGENPPACARRRVP